MKMTLIRSVTRAVLLCLILWPVLSTAETAQQHATPPNFKPIGAATLKVALFRIYDAQLSSPSGEYLPKEEPLLLELKYRREIHRDKLVEKTKQQLADRIEPELLTDVTATLKSLWPSVTDGDVVAFLLNPNGNGIFYYNGQHLGALPHPQFNRAFMDIWLGQDSSYPKLASKLRGER
ncbi:chalcone isomerase family protein [Halioxenophilus aromaticivorans]|uniref:Chalcone isomerase domain-containing protein n=1 Tax=Halioxenophilus aromaticivorans TaxID=1306992 RepID=A0AAV3U508_9ALTE